jgi:hypothetical protein
MPSMGFFLFFVLYVYLFVLIVQALLFVLYCTTHATQTSMPPAVFEPAVPTSGRSLTHALDREATGICVQNNTEERNLKLFGQ